MALPDSLDNATGPDGEPLTFERLRELIKRNEQSRWWLTYDH